MVEYIKKKKHDTDKKKRVKHRVSSFFPLNFRQRRKEKEKVKKKVKKKNKSQAKPKKGRVDSGSNVPERRTRELTQMALVKEKK